MEKELITKLHKNFEDFVHEKDGVEFWYVRELQRLLGYERWEGFVKVIEKAKVLATSMSRYHVGNSRTDQTAYEILIQCGILPEALLPKEDVKKLERRMKAEEKKLPKSIKKLASDS